LAHYPEEIGGAIVKERVLIVDDDHEFLELAEVWLRDAGYETVVASDGIEALQRAYANRPDVVLTDIRMPRMDGWELCRRLRDMCDTPVIILTVNDAKSDLLRGFGLGADDYITKPAHLPELGARIEAILKRCGTRGGERTGFHNEEIDVDWASRQVWVRGRETELTPTEFRLLSCLIENRGWVVTHEQALRSVWGSNYVGDKSYVKLYIRYLREKIEAEPSNPKWILTERGVGYRFSA